MRRLLVCVTLCALTVPAQLLNPQTQAAFRVGKTDFTRGKVDSLVSAMANAQAQQARTQLNSQQMLQLRFGVVQEILSWELLKLEAQARGLKPSSAIVTKMFKAYRAQFRTDKEYKGFLKATNLTEAALKQKMSERSVATQLIERIAPAATKPPADKDMRQYYEANKSKFPVNDSLRVARILSKNTGADAQMLLEGLGAQVRLKKAPFPVLAAQNSDDANARKTGGMLAPAAAGDFGADCAQALKGLKPGDVSRVCKGKDGLNLFQVLARNDGRYESYRDRIAYALMMRSEEQRMQKLQSFTEGLRSKYEVKFYDPSYDPSQAGGARQPQAPAMPGLSLPGLKK